MTHFIRLSGGYITTLINEFKHVLSAGSETTTCKFHDTTAQQNGRPQCVLQQLHTTREKKRVFFIIVRTVKFLTRTELKEMFYT